MTTFIVIAIIAMAIIGLIVIGQLVAITMLLLAMRSLLQMLREQIDPLVTKSSRLLQTANDVAETVQEATNRVSNTAVTVSGDVATRVDRTTLLLQRLVTAPVIAAIATASGVQGGYRAWRMARRMDAVTRKMREAREESAIVHPYQIEENNGENVLPRAA